MTDNKEAQPSLDETISCWECWQDETGRFHSSEDEAGLGAKLIYVPCPVDGQEAAFVAFWNNTAKSLGLYTVINTKM